MKVRSRICSGGFTLLEIMVALALLGLVVAAIYSSWVAIMRGSNVGLKAAASVQRSRIAVRTLEDALTSARSFAADVQHYAFVGENGESDATLSFVSRLSESFPRSGKFDPYDVRRLTFSLERGPNGSKQLILRQNPILMDPDKDETEHPVVLAKDIKSFEIAFWDPKSADWLDEWTQTNQLPLMVKVTLRWGGDNSSSPQGAQEITRVIALPSVMVQPIWQAPGAGFGARPGAQPGLPQPGAPQPGATQPGAGQQVIPQPGIR